MKRKVVVKVHSMNRHKSRPKALKTVAIVSGVESIALKGEEKDQIEVTGEDIDAFVITKSLRKKLGFAELVAVEPIEKPTAAIAKPAAVEAKPAAPVGPGSVPSGTSMPYFVTEIKYVDDPACCSIM